MSGCLGWMRAREWPRQLLIATLVVAFMVLGTFLGQQLQQTFGYQQPLFLTWFGTSFLAVLLLGQFLGFAIPLCATGGGHCVSPLLAAHMFLTRIHNLMTTTTTATIVQKERDQEIDEEHPFPEEGAEDHESYLLRSQTHSYSEFEERPSTVEERQSAWLLCSRAVLFSVFWMMANYLFSMAQAFTTSSSLLTLEQAATVFVFILSVWLINEQVTFPKVLAVGICIGGVIIFAFAATSSSSSSNNKEETWRELIGDLLVLASTLCTALYMVLFKKLMHFPLSILVLNCFLGLIGLSAF
ncbi:MAG: hypothetical protein Q8P67_28335, partial [archaeon]|nr:hypothetical protein [archaeon]